jgi:cytochrome b pre-mRNA-processing protein 3
LSFLKRLFGGTERRRTLDPLYRAIVAVGRDPEWYRAGQVPDTIQGRFDMMAALVALVMLRIEREGEACRETSALLTEAFVADMDASLRQIGVGDYVVGKHVGRLMGALGGRLAAFRAAGADGIALVAAVRRNIFHESPPSENAPTWVAERLDRVRRGLEEVPADALLAGRIPAP